MSYLEKPMSIAQSHHVGNLLQILFDLQLISETTFAYTATYFDDFIYEEDILPLKWRPFDAKRVAEEWLDEDV